jgi:hypothetical protein
VRCFGGRFVLFELFNLLELKVVVALVLNFILGVGPVAALRVGGLGREEAGDRGGLAVSLVVHISVLVGQPSLLRSPPLVQLLVPDVLFKVVNPLLLGHDGDLALFMLSQAPEALV